MAFRFPTDVLKCLFCPTNNRCSSTRVPCPVWGTPVTLFPIPSASSWARCKDSRAWKVNSENVCVIITTHLLTQNNHVGHIVKVRFIYNYRYLVKFFLLQPTLCNSQVDVYLSETVSDLRHDTQCRLVARECFLDGWREMPKWKLSI